MGNGGSGRTLLVLHTLSGRYGPAPLAACPATKSWLRGGIRKRFHPGGVAHALAQPALAVPRPCGAERLPASSLPPLPFPFRRLAGRSPLPGAGGAFKGRWFRSVSLSTCSKSGAGGERKPMPPGSRNLPPNKESGAGPDPGLVWSFPSAAGPAEPGAAAGRCLCGAPQPASPALQAPVSSSSSSPEGAKSRFPAASFRRANQPGGGESSAPTSLAGFSSGSRPALAPPVGKGCRSSPTEPNPNPPPQATLAQIVCSQDCLTAPAEPPSSPNPHPTRGSPNPTGGGG